MSVWVRVHTVLLRVIVNMGRCAHSFSFGFSLYVRGMCAACFFASCMFLVRSMLIARVVFCGSALFVHAQTVVLRIRKNVVRCLPFVEQFVTRHVSDRRLLFRSSRFSHHVLVGFPETFAHMVFGDSLKAMKVGGAMVVTSARCGQ